MHIEEYQFGSIRIDSKNYDHDIEVRSNGEILAWQRKESHIIDTEDIKRAVEQKPDLIIIGNGDSGMAQVTEDAKKEIESKQIPVIIEITRKAVEIFNLEIKKGKNIIGLFHLTC